MGRPSPEGANCIPVTAAALFHRMFSARKKEERAGLYRAHYQLGVGGGQVEAYWVEKRWSKKPSWHLVYLVLLDGLTWAECDCRWFLKGDRRKTVCAHILAAVLAHRERN